MEFGSAKNIPIASKKEYLEMIIQAMEKFNANLSWYVFFKLNPHIVGKGIETFGFRSTRAPPRLKELRDFEKDLVKLVQNVKFRKRSNHFLKALNIEAKRISAQKDLIVSADKTSNRYLVPPEKYLNLLDREVQKNYKKVDPENVKHVEGEHTKAAADLKIADRMFVTTPREAYITLKDHKEDFQENPKVRLINATKPDLGKVAKKILENVINEVKEKNKSLMLATDTKNVLEWFKNIQNKKIYKFVNFDVDTFYPSITPALLNSSLEWGMQYTSITEQQKKVIFQASKSFLYTRGEAWVKKGPTNFDIGMGGYHGAQACEIVGLFMLSKLVKLPNFRPLLYRDDGLGITSSSARQTGKLREAIIKVFKDHGLSITIHTGLTKVNFLNVTLDLEKDEFKPFRKPGDKPLYVSALSNHPPAVLKNIPLGINKRLCETSSNREVFQNAIPPFQRELENCGHKHKLVWMGEEPKKKSKTRSKAEVWFNPPYSLNVQTNVGKEFLSLLDKHFPKGHQLNTFINRNTVKMSYRCLPNMGRKVSSHNNKVLKNYTNNTLQNLANCNCQKNSKHECPIPGACNQNGAIYEAVVTTNDGKRESYVGLAKNFKKRFSKHKATLNDRTADGQTTLSRYFWEQNDRGKNPVVMWQYLERNIPDFNPVSGLCKLCTREKFQIVLNPSVASLNHRTEMFAPCRHKRSYLFGEPPD